MSSWIRIEDDTYIDDSLVTCAEYQLFIDEMRKQGQYHQPDHWTNYYFSPGQARQPILGVRLSDGEAFGDWLTGREGAWQFRIPTPDEALKHPVSRSYQSPVGYWLEDKNYKAQFAWIGSVPINPRNLNHDLDISLNQIHDRYITYFQKHRDNEYPYLILERNWELAFDFDNVLKRNKIIFPDTYDKNMISLIDRDHVFFRNITTVLTRATDRIEEVNITLYNKKPEKKRVRDTRYAIDPNVLFATGFKRFRIRISNFFSLLFSKPIYRDKRTSNDPTWQIGLIELWVGLLRDIYTLQARMDGTSPAFEGIRLVRERIK